MRSRITVGIFSIMIAVCSLSIGGCSGNDIESGKDITQSNIKQIINNSENHTTSENSESSSENSLSSGTLGTPPVSSEEPTIFIGLDGKPILTSEITKLENTDKTAETLTEDDRWAPA